MATEARRDRKPYSYDDRCEDLAELFLLPTGTSRQISDLAQAIQDTIEAFCRDVERQATGGDQ